MRVCASVCEVSEEERGREGYRRKDRVSARGRSNIKLWNRVVNLFSDVSGYFPVTFRLLYGLLSLSLTEKGLKNGEREE